MKTGFKELVEPKYADYKDSYIAFIDLLGFSRKVKAIRSESEFLHITQLLSAIKHTADTLRDSDPMFRNLELLAVSDSIIVTAPYTSEYPIFKIVALILKLQSDLIGTDFRTLSRGYLTRGLVYHKDGIVFGPAYITAYTKEKIIGHAPRVVVDLGIVAEMKRAELNTPSMEGLDTVFNYLREDTSDGCYFIDYFKPVSLIAGVSKENLVQERAGIKQFVEDAIISNSNDDALLRKYMWMKNYLSVTENYLL